MLLLIHQQGIRTGMAQCAPNNIPTVEMGRNPAANRRPQPIRKFCGHHLSPGAFIDLRVNRQPL